MPWQPLDEHDAFPTLGFQIAEWIEEFCCHGPGDVQGEPVELDREWLQFLADAYRLDPDTGRREYDEGVLSRPKGRAKSELAGFIGLAEAFGPVRFDGWDADGQPVGRPVRSPLLKCLATEESQAGNTFENIAFIASEWGPDVHPDVYGGVSGSRQYQSATALYLPHGGEIRACTAGSASKDGGKETWVCADEPLALDTPIPTPDGWTTMGRIRPGDYVFGVDGRPVLVWGVSPVKHDRPCYQVTFDDGASVVTDAAHRWWVFDRKSTAKWAERTTEQMATANQYGGKRFAVPRPEPLECEPQDLPLDPYVLGLWLGDGDSRRAAVSVGRDDLDHVLEQLTDSGFTTQVYDYDESKGAVVVRFNHGQRYGKAGTSQHALRELGVLGNKHVPDLYLWASVEQRLALLQGLMDSDGYANERGNCTFTSSSRVLADAVVFLARSLGWRASVGNWNSDERWKLRTAGTWRVSFTPAGMAPFRLKRKAARCRTTAPSPNRAIASIEPVDSVPVRCIAVDSDDHLFLAGESMLPTHNTHLYVLRELKAMYGTVRRNLGKRKAAEPWLMQTTTAYRPGEQSIAEETLTAWRKGELSPSVLVDHREAKGRVKIDDKSHTMAQLRQVYGPAAEWMDLDRIYREMLDPRSCPDVATAARYFLNRAMSGTDAWIAADVHGRQTRTGDVVKPGEHITLGFDGSLNEDTTVLRGCRMSDGFLFRIGAWPKPDGPAGIGWEVPRADVLATVREAFARYRVVRGYFDPHEWRSDIDALAEEFGEERVVRWATTRDVAMAGALDRLHADLVNGTAWHDDDPLAHEHYGNAYVRHKGPHRLVRKEHPNSPRKIDSVVGDALAYEARADALAEGWTDAPEDRRVFVFRR